MNKRIFVTLCCLTISSLSISRIYAQRNKDIRENLRIPDFDNVQILITQDGSTNIGRIVEIGINEIQFETDFGKIAIPIAKIKEIKEIPASSIKKGRYWFPNPNVTRLYFAPTGRCLKKGRGYFADYYLFFPMATYGITDNITIGGGFSLLPGIDISEQIFYLTPKLGLVSTDNLALSIGALIIKIPGFGEENSPIVGILYGVGTYGKPDASLSFGLGYGFVDNELAEKPMVVLGGERRLSQRIAFVTENWIFPGVEYPLISYGLRFFGESLSVDFALIILLGEEFFFPGFPYIDFVFNY